jgi:tetratricopeptide (TPR) repeat protein
MKIFLIMALLTFPLSLGLANEAFEANEHLIVHYEDQSHIFKLPDPMKESSSYQLTIYPQEGLFSGSQKKQKQKELTPEDIDLLLHKANHYFLQQDYTSSLETLLYLYKHDPENTRALNMMGSVFFTLSDFDLATKYWSKSLALNKEQPDVKAHMTKIQKKLEETKKKP